MAHHRRLTPALRVFADVDTAVRMANYAARQWEFGAMRDIPRMRALNLYRRAYEVARRRRLPLLRGLPI